MSTAAPPAPHGQKRRFNMPELTRTQNLILVVVVIVLAIFIPPAIFEKGSSQMNIAVLSAAYVVMALGLNIIVGYAGLLDLGYVAFFAIGAYTMGYFGSGFWGNAGGGDGLHFLVGEPASNLPGIHFNFLDRKSTRLNSSHANISYAVFCL